MRMTKEEWLEQFGGCETLENTAALMGELDHSALDGSWFCVWSEFERQCERDEYFAGTRWREIVSGIYPGAARFYRREKPHEGSWMLITAEMHGPHNRNSYRCYECGHEWVDHYPAVPDDDCDECGTRDCQAWLTEEVDGGGNVVATEMYWDPDAD